MRRDTNINDVINIQQVLLFDLTRLDLIYSNF